ncbi:16S rRNA (adenine(1518)-N(6)/adenine(1519)-N(6))-dimethyltransferase RsmA [Wolinella succinogenes]|uniref:16S rRNA (adenine(1518)-N(6)/adenine(1519)-N(6))- dimethyltransferase RsmA n=1 Tax=Wolinella succinogenes TaxID=844 RepID=UPI002FC6B111
MTHKAKKQFGQNFLKDEHYLHQIIESIPEEARKVGVVEVGPGLGDLTNKLLGFWDVLAFEVDTDLRPHLEKRFQKELSIGRFEIRFGDVMEEWREKRSLTPRPYVLVSNLPYYVATAIILKALKDPMCHSLVVMVQKEVAEKFCARSGESDFSALSVITESYGESELLFEVPPQAFEPAPKVTSAVFRVVKHHGEVAEGLEELLRLAFSAPRKKVLKNLASGYETSRLKEAFGALNLKEEARAHELETSHYHRLLKILNKGGNHNGREEQIK